jgi:hypothetical protein
VFARFGLYLDATLLSPEAALMLGAVMVSTLIAAAAPSIKMYTEAKQVT